MTEYNEVLYEYSDNGKNGFNYFKFFVRRFFIFVLIMTLLGGMFGGFWAYKSNVVYEAKERVMFKTDVSYYNSTTRDYENSISVSLAKIYLPDATKILRSAKFVKAANDRLTNEAIQNFGVISENKISTDYRYDSLIFSISYSDYSEEAASLKLKTIVSTASEFFAEMSENMEIMAEDVMISPMQKEPTVSEKNSYGKRTILGLFLGFVLGVFIACIINILDNTVRDADIVNDITGVNLIGCIEDLDSFKK